MELNAGEVIGQYRVESVLGQGGMAIVYRVRHEQLGSEHALKVLTVSSKSIRARLLQEGRVQATLRHENIVSVTDVVSIGDAPGLVMELVKGPTLEDLLSHKKLSLAQVDLLAQGILRGVAAAHRQDLIHRDLKPANILLELDHGRIVPKVADFGLAKVLDAGGGMSQTRSGMAMGTPHYMAPEQIRDAKSVDARTDLFALGAIFYEMISGERAFPGEDMLTIFSAIAEGKPRPIREHCPDLPEHMAAAIEGALHIDREQRIGSCDALLALWRDEDHTDPGLGGVDSWTDELMAAATAVSGGGGTVSSAPTMEPPRNSDTWSAQSAMELQTSPTMEAPSEPPTTGALGPGTWTDEFVEPDAFQEPNPSKASSSGTLKIVGLAVVIVAAVGVVVFSQLKPGQEEVPAETVSEVAPVTEPSVFAAPAAPAAPAGAAPAGAAPAGAAPAAKPALTDSKKGPSKQKKTSEPRASNPSTTRSKGRPADRPASPALQVEAAPTKPAAQPPASRKGTARVETPRKSSGPPPGKAWLKLDPGGDVVPVWVRSGGGSFRPGDDIPAGTYSLQAFFKEGTPKDVGSVTLKSGDVRTLKCTKALVGCIVK